MRKVLLACVLLATAALAAGTPPVSCAALRDGLWSIARTHARELAPNEARLVTLESYANEQRWQDIIKEIDGWGDAATPSFAFYRAFALAKLGKVDEAISILEKTDFASAEEKCRAGALQAVLLLERGKIKAANSLAEKLELEKGGTPEQLVAAEIYAAQGETNRAKSIWRTLAESPKTTEPARVMAALQLDDYTLITNIIPQVKLEIARNQLTLQAAVHDLAATNKLSVAGGVIRTAAQRHPDRYDVQPAFLAYAHALLLAERNEDAVAAYRDALEIWPALAKNGAVQEERAWALRKMGHIDEAMDAFSAAESCATNVLEKAQIVLAQGDMLAEAGRAEESMERYRLLLSKYPDTPAGKKLAVLVKLKDMETRGRELYRTFQFDEARKLFAKLAKEDPSRADKMAYLDVLCLYGLNRDEEALAKARELAAQATDSEARNKAKHWLAKYAYSQARWHEASKLFTEYAASIAPDPEAATALIWAARAAYAGGAFENAVTLSTKCLNDYPKAKGAFAAYLVQGEALIALARFEEAILVLDRAFEASVDSAADRLTARMLKADALFAMGADNPTRYEEALLTYHMIGQGEALPPSRRLVVAYKVARTLEKMGRLEGALDEYYTNVVLSYRSSRLAGVVFDDEARAVFVKAAFRLADEYERRGLKRQAERILELVAASDVPAAVEAERRIDKLQTGGLY